MEPEKGKNMMQGAMEKVPSASQLEIVKTAHKHRIDENEPAWVLVELAMDAVGGVEKIAQALREASVNVTEATRDVVKESREKAKIEIEKMQEETKVKIAAALSETLETEIGKAVDRLQNQSNRPLHKNWLIAMGVGIILAAGAGGWGIYSIHKKWVAEGVARGIDYGIDVADPTAKSFRDLIDCTGPGWKVQWSNDGKKAWCYPYPDPKTGKPYGWRIR
ncbi:hypothetical protein [Leptospirillum ferriphilum]|uniref:Uncharacterized protein n=1 Tax=Leptospirillum ferriphilum (strain ML-04) TaxID=1048260 RepID=J9ZE10_LEPFM|nr:hypothetical protein [Leptospirillum ferriphilum]AFS53877.1 hypothetical protein LFML04_1675 [Leptospirillum ferriphilum ML-04]